MPRPTIRAHHTDAHGTTLVLYCKAGIYHVGVLSSQGCCRSLAHNARWTYERAFAYFRHEVARHSGPQGGHAHDYSTES